jgi:hypothetical protein
MLLFLYSRLEPQAYLAIAGGVVKLEDEISVLPSSTKSVISWLRALALNV